MNFFLSFPSGTFPKKARIEKMNKKLDRFLCECEACRLDYPILEKLRIKDKSVANGLEMQMSSGLEAKKTFPVSMMNNFHEFCKHFEDLNIEFPTYESFAFEKLINMYFIIIGKFKTVWPLLNREYYQEMGSFIPQVIRGNELSGVNFPFFTTSVLRNPNMNK